MRRGPAHRLGDRPPQGKKMHRLRGGRGWARCQALVKRCDLSLAADAAGYFLNIIF
jgi:hypothetical protein